MIRCFLLGGSAEDAPPRRNTRAAGYVSAFGTLFCRPIWPARLFGEIANKCLV
jgi:hypothetical protein